MSANGITRSFCYDANGNMTLESGDVTRTITWTSFNKPNSITSGAIGEAFIYGPSRERLVSCPHVRSENSVV